METTNHIKAKDSSKKTGKLPSLFVPHGAPDLVLSQHPAADFLRKLHTLLPTPEGIVIISAHWETEGLQLTTSETLETIYDFSGFSKELYQIRYPAKTSPQLIKSTQNLLHNAGYKTKPSSRGLDHGAWAPLHLIYPDANIPIVQLSLDINRPYHELINIGRALEPLRSQNTLIIGSGALVHNLRMISREGSPAPDWAQEFDGWIDEQIRSHNINNLANFAQQAPFAKKAHPTPEHFLPLLVALGAGGDTYNAEKIHASYSYGSLSMSTWMFNDYHRDV